MTTEELLASFSKAELPWSEEAESAIISILFSHPNKIEDCPPPDAFFHVHHRLIIQTFHAMIQSGKPVDLFSVTHEFREMGKLDWIGGAVRLTNFCTSILDVGNFGYYASIIREKYQFRAMISALTSATSSLLRFNASEEVSATDTLQNVVRAVNEALNDDGSPDLESFAIGGLISEVLEECEAAAHSGRKFSGISTGIDEFDVIMGGLEPGCLTVIAAESSDGKSSLGRQILESAAIEGHHVIDYTYEMMPRAEARRVLCSQGRVDAGNLKRGMLTREEQMNLGIAARRSAKWDFHVADVAGKTIEQICRDIIRRSRKRPAGKRVVAMIDYIQLCQTSNDSHNREREIAHITSTAKQCAKTTGAHIIMPSQVNKDGDVRESKAIEQDADNLIMIKKQVKKDKKPSWKKGDDEADEPNFERDIFFHKVRDGERYKTVKSRLTGKHFRFEIIRQGEN